jgi:hypothetical protein
MNDGMVRRWCKMFSEGRTNIHVMIEVAART